MQIKFSQTAIEQLKTIKDFISKDNPDIAKKHIKKVMKSVKQFLEYPNIGKVNAVYNRNDIREIVIEGYKVIYKIYAKSIVVLVVYKNIDLDESKIDINF